VFSRLHFHFGTLWKLKKMRKNLPFFERIAIADDVNFVVGEKLQSKGA